MSRQQSHFFSQALAWVPFWRFYVHLDTGDEVLKGKESTE